MTKQPLVIIWQFKALKEEYTKLLNLFKHDLTLSQSSEQELNIKLNELTTKINNGQNLIGQEPLLSQIEIIKLYIQNKKTTFKNALFIFAPLSVFIGGVMYVILPNCIEGCQIAQSLHDTAGQKYQVPVILANGLLKKAILNNHYVFYTYVMTNYTCSQLNAEFVALNLLHTNSVEVLGDDGRKHQAMIIDVDNNLCNNANLFERIETL